MEGYSLVLPNTMEKHKCARIVLLVKNGIDITVHREFMHEDVAAIWVSVRNGRRRVMKIGGVYREHQMLLKPKPNPTLTEEAQLERWQFFLQGWQRAADQNMCVLIGDTNLNFNKWQNPIPSQSRMVEKTKELMETEGFVQVIKGITRTWRGQVDSLLDQCWLNMPQRVISYSNESCGSSDHNFISALLRTKEKNPPAQEIRKRQWSLFNPERFRDKISKIDWNSFYESQNLDVMNTLYEENVGAILESEAPMRNIQKRKYYRNWVDSEMKEEMRLRDEQRDVARRTDLTSDSISYRRRRNYCGKLLRRKKNDFMSDRYKSFNEKNYVRKTFRTTKEILGWSSQGQPGCFLIRGIIIRRPIELANALQDYFEDKIRNLMGKLKKWESDPLDILNKSMESWSERSNLPTFSLREISVSETLKIIERLGNSTAYGRDGLDALAVKTAKDYLSPHICHLVNTSISKKTFAIKWKSARVIPILKSRDCSQMEPASYRPVSLLPTVSKIVERAVQLQLQKHKKNHNLFHVNSHAYRQNKSTTTAMLQVLDRIYRATDKNLMTSLMAIDQSLAFDCDSHLILVRKLWKYKCSENTITWIENYLNYRSQQVSIGRHLSRMTALDRGVPQGSILGPLLYLIYTNELAETTKDDSCNDISHRERKKLFSDTCDKCGLIVMYADDATFVISNKNRVMNQFKLNTSLAKLEIFLSTNELAINVSKTAIVECMIKQKRGRTPGEPPHLIVEDQSKPGELLKIKDSECLRILGSNIQLNISWQQHLEGGKKAVLPGIRRQLGQLKMMGRQLPRASRKILAEGLLISKFIYLISQWGGATENYLVAAQRLQNKIARWVTGAGAKVRISTLLEDIGWLSIKELTVLEDHQTKKT